MEDEEISQLHQEILYPSVRVRTKKAGGSGTIIDSRPDEKGNFHSMVLTNHHVIKDLINVFYEFDPRVGDEIMKEKRGIANVDIFQYDMSKVIGALGIEATLEAYDADKDLALLKLRKKGKMDYVANMLPLEADKDIHLFDKVYAAGCSLGHPTLVNEGIVTSESDIIDDLPYYMMNCGIIFGNSGGGTFIEHDGEYKLIGVPSRVAVYGWGSAVPQMGYFIPPETVYGFFKEQNFQYLYDNAYDVEKCAELRKVKFEKQQKGLEALLDKL